MRPRTLRHMAIAVAAVALALAAVGPVSADSWYSGQRSFGGTALSPAASVEPAVNMADGSQIFLLTPTGAQTHANARAHAPLYLVLYPGVSTIPASTLNCQPTNCDHANTFPPYDGPGGGLKGHDHLVGIPPTGDFNVAWDVYAIAFTPQGFADGAINTRILTESALDAAIAAGDVTPPIDLNFAFNCSMTSVTTYLNGTPLSL
jgi:hypothetical protein